MLKTLGGCLGATICLFITACQSSPLNDFDHVKPGMEKSDVLEVMGNPRRTERFHGKDRWTYVFYDKQMRFEKEVHFFEGNAIYVGNVWEPPANQSAVAVDQANEIKNKALDEQYARDIVKHREEYQNYEGHVKGTSSPAYVPDFKPLQ